jgi:putative ABC transport system permease protein
VDAGFRHEDLLTMRLTLPTQQYQGAAIAAFFGELRERAAGIAGVQSAAVASQFPPNAFLASELTLGEGSGSADATVPRALVTVVSSSYFETLGVPLLAGRAFGPQDGADLPPVAVINEAAARRFYPSGDVLGKRIKLGDADSDNPWFEIVGVVGTARNRGLDRPGDPEVFGLLDQVGQVFNQSFLILRAEDDPYQALPAVRRIVEEMDADQPIYAVQTVEEAIASASSSRRATTLLLTLFGGLALLLAALGVYAVVSFAVSARTQEIGLRVALGASRARVGSLVVRQSLVPVLVGAALGVGLMFPLGAGLRQLLFEVSETDPATLAVVAIVLLGVAAAASAIPAMRASRMDPVEALRLD